MYTTLDSVFMPEEKPRATVPTIRYKLVVGPCFESRFIDEKQVGITFIPYLDPGIKVPEINYEKCTAVDLDENRVFLYEEVLRGIYAYGLLHKNDAFHGGRPYIWSSRHTVFEEITGIRCVRADHLAIISKMAILPEGWIWSDFNHSWLTKPELVKFIHKTQYADPNL